ncbi:putative GTP-binding protein 6 [Schistosoma haematobium]|uniref:GTP-binding protein 6 n=1 Tax=Schistosoma haematobium TaxID=6185 RepID=A0A922LH59_SCHHA|nr:putative GTP-binding protein 6 [Schistosoma haematobium]KAH9584555.1 putative GTP-binding protein 6 [Schistosoma haematobium]
MQQAWLMPVYDRYTLVVQLFNLRSRTPEAKLQAKLAEIGLLRARIPAFFETPNMIKCLVDRSDFATKERLLQILNQTEVSLLNQLEKISKQRIHHRRNHRRDMEKHHLPLVAVVGYTNAGKTSLIRYLSKSDKLASSPEVFATLDITHHRSRLPILPNKVEENNMTSDQLFSENGSDGGCSNSIGLPGIQMLLLDTIGFMSDLPTNLLAAFRATLDECLDAVSLLRVCISFITQSHVVTKLRISLLFSFEGVFTTIMVFIYQL